MLPLPMSLSVGICAAGMAFASAATCSAAVSASQQPTREGTAEAWEGSDLPSPADYLGFPVGADRRLADWSQVTGYLSALAERSDRIRMDTLGTTTLGRPLVVLTISEPRNLASLAEILATQQLLADPRRLEGAGELEDAIDAGRTIVLITCSIHSTEVGSSQVPLRIAYRLAASREPDVVEVLRNTVVLLVPSLNPDGVDLVVEWYRETVGTAWEGVSPPFLYHHYVGHDNNRDWYAFTQIETGLVVEKIHNIWHPQIVHDIHQQGSFGSRFFVPPWIDPIEPNVDPLLVSSGNALGSEMAWALLRAGKQGVVLNATYDAWTPARAYSHYHGGVRLLSETASAEMATPLEVGFDELEPGRGFDPRRRSWNFPELWEGGTWRLSDIVGYMEAGAFALLGHAARHREEWLRGFVSIGERAVAGWERWPEAWVIPADGGAAEVGRPTLWRGIGVSELLRILLTGGVEVGRAEAAFTAAGRSFPAGTYIVGMHQPYASFAQTLLERQEYPVSRTYEGGPVRRPYDVTAHTLPLLFGVEAIPVEESPTVPLEAVRRPPAPSTPLRLAAGVAGTDRRIALYQPFHPSIDEGWTRWLFDRYEVPYASVHNQDIRDGSLAGYTALLLPSVSAEVLREGREEGTVPGRYAGGLGEAGAAELRRFVEEGGTLVALDRSATYAIDVLDLPVTDVLEGLEETEYYAPGSLVRLEVDLGHPMAVGMESEAAAWLEGGHAFEPAQDSTVRIVASYGKEPVLMSGWLQGEEYLAGRPALVVVPFGKGRVVLFGFRPQYRGQSLATYPLLFNALKL